MNNQQIEDIIKEYKPTIEKNIITYEKIIFEMYEWLNKKLKEKTYIDFKREFNRFYGKMVNKYRVYCKKSILVYVYKNLINEGFIEEKELLLRLLQKRPSRNISGIAVITVLTSPYPDGQNFSCRHNCYYCPNEPGQPRSYLKKEPAVARANRNNFDASLQMIDRINTLLLNGHSVDKVEIIIEGGTYTEYPIKYLERFHRDLIYTANTYFDNNKRQPLDIGEEIQLNKSAQIRIIGVCIETRPDALINSEMYENTGKMWLELFRLWGVTRVQIGVQHTDNEILEEINRGHYIEDAVYGMKYLKDNCFKVDIHLMPDLPGSTPEKDKSMFDYVFETQYLQPDQIKIYPCEITPWTVIEKMYKNGKFVPYSETNINELLDVVKYAMEKCKPWVRLPRIIRDIPMEYIQGGNMYPNMRQMLDENLKNEGKYSMDIRARECGRNNMYNIENAKYITRHYKSNDGDDYFISLESEDERCIFGFLRLRIPNKDNNLTIFNCLVNKALIREIHVYGNLLNIGEKSDLCSQHRGVGKKLVSMAERIADDYLHINGIAVISGIGVMDYYKKLGYIENEYFMVKNLTRNMFKVYSLFCLAFLTIIILVNVFSNHIL
jgi:ELP3 family radical SAM enzyme/protein acetyltransferase